MSHFKKTLLGAVVSSLMMSGAAFAEGANGDAAEKYLTKDSFAYEVYGIIAMQAAYRDYDSGDSVKDDNLGGMQFNNESRIGFRGKKQFANFGPTFLWQIEGGYVDPSFGGEGAGLGERDTFVGFESENMGQIRVGRVLTPLYELVDWPASNPGLGDVYDWGGSIGGAKYQDRQSNTVRWDSPMYGNAFSLDVAAGAGDKAGLGEGDDYWAGLAAHYKIGPVQIDAAYEGNRDIATEGTKWDNNTYLVGLQGWFDNGISFFAQYKMMDAKSTAGDDEKQNAMSAGLMYTTGDWQYKLGYAANFELERNGKTLDNTNDDVLSAQVMYFVDPSAVLYVRARTLDFGDKASYANGYQDKDADGKVTGTERWKSDDYVEFSVGVEYYF
ncbi:porin [Vibrio aestuarianus]|uniref:Membrane protein n=2 Tax=Vibrio aestuarianus TaxID=28171 RepID=A0ABM9FN85_9VIBR|nr:porin [Vibrio aestuarianus]MDE1214189.1 porin [Vibrio aestuarianus]MDE1216219.1 porin [Vibrio aestuarianus]MDE1227510.1 porin [Vibrio aestuarianus]MDE1239754.1 porin [Vibrio aestuarianus]MDE1249001.1 porin [Vibrio aestuarianus]